MIASTYSKLVGSDTYTDTDLLGPDSAALSLMSEISSRWTVLYISHSMIWGVSKMQQYSMFIHGYIIIIEDFIHIIQACHLRLLIDGVERSDTPLFQLPPRPPLLYIITTSSTWYLVSARMSVTSPIWCPRVPSILILPVEFASPGPHFCRRWVASACTQHISSVVGLVTTIHISSFIMGALLEGNISSLYWHHILYRPLWLQYMVEELTSGCNERRRDPNVDKMNIDHDACRTIALPEMVERQFRSSLALLFLSFTNIAEKLIKVQGPVLSTGQVCCSSTGCIGHIWLFCAADTILLLYTLLCLCRTYCMLLVHMTDQWAVYLYR